MPRIREAYAARNIATYPELWVESLSGCNKEWTKEGKKMRIRAAAKDFIWCLCDSRRDPSFIGLQEKNEVIKEARP